jgi:hypothetical protein
MNDFGAAKSMDSRFEDETGTGLRISRTSAVLMAGLFVCCFLAWFFAEVWNAPEGIVWHVMHGNYASFQGREVAIPWDMWVNDSGRDQLTITRQAPNNPMLHSPSGIMLISRNSTVAPLDMTKDYEYLNRFSRRPLAGFRFEGTHEIAALKGKGYCWEAVSLDSAYVSISCWFDKDTLGASYVGSAAYRANFYRAVGTVSDAPGP